MPERGGPTITGPQFCVSVNEERSRRGRQTAKRGAFTARAADRRARNGHSAGYRPPSEERQMRGRQDCQAWSVHGAGAECRARNERAARQAAGRVFPRERCPNDRRQCPVWRSYRSDGRRQNAERVSAVINMRRETALAGDGADESSAPSPVWYRCERKYQQPMNNNP